MFKRWCKWGISLLYNMIWAALVIHDICSKFCLRRGIMEISSSRHFFSGAFIFSESGIYKIHMFELRMKE